MAQQLQTSYQQARRDFTRAALKYGYALTPHVLEGLTGPDGEELACDVAIKPQEGARHAVVTTSGLHGIEGYAGSALQTHWMKTVHARGPVDMIHIHALNPWGFAWHHRSDQDNVDSNRNFRGDLPALGANPDYAHYADLILPEYPTLANKLQIIWLVASKGLRTMQNIVQKGQYTHHDGLFYGGAAPSWSRSIWEKIQQDDLNQYDGIVHIDLHTGLGKKGAMKILHGGAGHDAEFATMKTLWPQENLEALGDDRQDNISASVTGDIIDSWRPYRQGRNVVAAAFETGSAVRGPLQVFFALQADHAAMARGEKDPVALQWIREGMIDAFIPRDAAFEAALFENNTRAFKAAVRNSLTVLPQLKVQQPA